jgi:hypothetical protein
MLVLLGGLAGGGALHAAATKIPRRLAGVVAAIVPWVLVLIGFGLLLALLRYARLRRAGQNHAEGIAAEEAAGMPDAEAARMADAEAAGMADTEAAGMADTEAAGRGPDTEEAGGWPAVQHADLQLRARIPRQPAHEAMAADEPDEAGQPDSELNPAPTPDSAGEEAGGPPAFRRTRSSPTPPRE